MVIIYLHIIYFILTYNSISFNCPKAVEDDEGDDVK